MAGNNRDKGMIRRLQRFMDEDSGASAIEYGLIDRVIEHH